MKNRNKGRCRLPNSFLASIEFVSLSCWDDTSSDDGHYKAWVYLAHSATGWPGSC